MIGPSELWVDTTCALQNTVFSALKWNFEVSYSRMKSTKNRRESLIGNAAKSVVIRDVPAKCLGLLQFPTNGGAFLVFTTMRIFISILLLDAFRCWSLLFRPRKKNGIGVWSLRFNRRLSLYHSHLISSFRIFFLLLKDFLNGPQWLGWRSLVY